MNTDQSKTPALRPPRGASVQNPKSKILWLLVPSLVLLAVLAVDLFPLLRGNDEWRWPLRSIELTARVFIPIATLGLYVVLSARWLKGFEREPVSRRYERWFLVFVIVAAPVIQLSLAAAVSRLPLLEFFGPTVSVHNSGYFTTAVGTLDLNSLLANFPAQMPSLPIHAQSHPPGPVIAHWLSWQVLRALPPLADAMALPLRTLQCHNPGLMVLDNAQIASASPGMLLPLLGGLAVWPLYALSKRITTIRAAAVTALLFPLLPLFAMWMSQWDQIYPLLLFIGLYLAHTGLEKNSWWRILLAGVPLSLASFFSVGNFVLMVIVGLYGIAWWVVRRMNSTADSRSRLKPTLWASLKLAALFALGCASIWLAYWLIYGVDPLSVISTGSRLAFESTTGNRSYGVWLLGNPIDFLVFLGFPIVILLVYNALKRIPFPKTLLPIALATFGTLILLWLSGSVRGEVGRLWMYFGPLVVMIAVGWHEAGGKRQEAGGKRQEAGGKRQEAGGTRQEAGGRKQEASDKVHASRFTFYAVLIALTALQLIIMNTRWLVNDSFLDEPPERSVVLNVPPMSFVTSAAFADQIALRGYDVDRVGGTIELTLHWQALAQPPHAYTVFAHVVDANGRQVGQQDNMPLRDQLPTSCWVPGEYVSDPYVIPLVAGAREPLAINVGLYRGDTGARLPRSDAQGDSVTLTVP
jgi:hypothetical protein